MTISVQSFTQLVENQVAAIQGVCKTLLDFTIGSILRALVEAFAGVGLFYQSQALQVAALTRASTSTGSDLDSFYADFNFYREAAQQSEGYLTFTSLTPTNARQLPVGTTAQTFDGSQKFIVLADATNGAYNATLNAYVLNAGTSSVTVLAQSVNAAAATNVVSGTINQITSAVPGIDTVTNTYAFAGGADPQSDSAFRISFWGYIASLSKATKTAVGFAVTSVQQGLQYALVENYTYAGSPQRGFFYVVVDDGSGNPSSQLLSNVYTAIDAVRGLAVTFAVYGPTIVTANYTMNLTTASGYTHSVVVATVQAAINAYINSLGLGVGLPYSRLAQVAYDASPGVANVTGVTLNSGTTDITASAQQVVKVGTASVT